MAGNENQVSQKRSVMEPIKEFSEYTSMHGIGRVFASRNPYRRFVWSIMTVFVLGYAIFEFVNIINDFSSYPVTTVVTLKHEPKQRFPAVTICNINKIRRSYTADDTKTFDLDLEALSFRIDRRSRTKLPCSEVNFTRVTTATFGNCYTFTVDDPKLMYTTKPGHQNGLILELDTEHRGYLFLTPNVGFKVTVHEHDVVPFQDDAGIFAQPGVTTSIGLKKTVTRRLPPPYGTCVNAHGTRSEQLSFFSDEKYKYTEESCRKSCFQMALYKKCNCCDEDFPCDKDDIFRRAGVTPEKGQTVPFCNITFEAITCVSNVSEQSSTDGLTCIKECFPGCNQTIFEKVVSKSLWPSDPYLDFVLHKLNGTVLKNMTFESRMSLKRFVETNFLRLEIYFDSLGVLEFVIQPKYDWSMLLGTVGGQLGLWLGFSLLTAIEIIELIIDTTLACIRRQKERNTPTQSEGM